MKRVALGVVLLAFVPVAWAQQMHLGHPKSDAPTSAQSSAAASDADSSASASELRDYSGTLGSDAIGAALVIRGNDVSGHYFRVADLQDVSLAGHTNDGGKQISLAVLGTDGKPVAEMFLRRAADERERYEGSFTPVGNAKDVRAVSLTLRDTVIAPLSNRYAAAGVKDAAEAERNAQGFVRALVAQDAAAAAQFVSFPLAVTENGRRELLHSAADFEAKFALLITPQFLAAVRVAPAHDMFATERGLMLGDGEVWFDAEGKAFAINNQAVKMFAGKKFLTNRGYVPAPRK